MTYDAPVEPEYPTLFRRYMSALCDGLLVFALIIAVGMLPGSGAAVGRTKFLAFVFLALWYEPIFTSRACTLGQWITGVRVRRNDDMEERISIGRALLRIMVKGALGWLSFFTMPFSPRYRAIHDMVAGSVVILPARRLAAVRASIVAAVLSVPAALSAQAPARDSSSVAAVIAEFHAALAAGDSTRALGLLAPDVTILEAGGSETLADYRSRHLAADIRFAQAVPATRGAPRIVVSGDVAWAVSTSETVGTFDGRPVNSVGAELMVLSRDAAGWRIRSIHWSSRRRAAP